MSVTGTLTQTGAAAETRVIGSLTAGAVALQGGRLTGTGTVTGPVTNSGGTVAPGLVDTRARGRARQAIERAESME